MNKKHKNTNKLGTVTVSHKDRCINGRLGNVNEAKYTWAKL